MNRARPPGSADLIAVVALAALGLVVAIVAHGWLRAAALLPLVVAVPGYAIGAALYPPGAISAGDRAVFSFAFSVGAAAIGGLALQVFVGLDRTAWLALLVSVAVAASILAWWRRTGLYAASGRLAPMPPARPIAIVATAVAIAGAGAAIVVTVRGMHDQQARQAFASLWAVRGREAGDPITVGVWNHAASGEYTLRVQHGRESIRSLRLRLGPRQHWQARLTALAGVGREPLLVTLYRHGVMFRSVELVPKVGS